MKFSPGLYFILIVFTSCGKQPPAANKDSQLLHTDTVKTSVPPLLPTHPESQGTAPHSSEFLFAASLPYRSGGEFLIPVRWKEEVTEDGWNAVKEAADSLIYSDNELTRRLVPAGLADEKFERSAPDSLYIYNEQHEFQGVFMRQRTEFVADMIEDWFAVAYNGKTAPKGDRLYGLMGARNFSEEQTMQETDPELMILLLQPLLPDSMDLTYRSKAYSLRDNSSFFGFFSAREEGAGDFSFFTEFRKDSLVSVLELKGDGVIISDLQITGAQANNRPVFLATLLIPDTDFITWVPLIYDGTAYRLFYSGKYPYQTE